MSIYEILYGTVYGNELTGFLRAENEDKAKEEAEKSLRPGFILLRVRKISGGAKTITQE